MSAYTEAETPIPEFVDEVTRILEGNDRAVRVEYDGEQTWTVHLVCHDGDEAEMARHEMVESLIEALGEEVCATLEFWSRSFRGGTGSCVELEILDCHDGSSHVAQINVESEHTRASDGVDRGGVA